MNYEVWLQIPLKKKNGGSKFGYPQIVRVQFRSGWPCMLVPSRPVTGSVYLYLHQVLSFLSLPWNSFRISISKTVGIMNHQLYDYEAPLHGHRVNFPRTWSTRSVLNDGSTSYLLSWWQDPQVATGPTPLAVAQIIRRRRRHMVLLPNYPRG